MLKYLARYTHRVAISNHRLIKIEEDKVFFHYKDYAKESAQKVMALDAVEFIRRFLLHVVPSGFVRIRHFGFLAHRFRAEKLRLCRQLLASAGTDSLPPAAGGLKADGEPAGERHRCPHCGAGKMIIVERFERDGSRPARTAETAALADTS